MIKVCEKFLIQTRILLKEGFFCSELSNRNNISHRMLTKYVIQSLENFIKSYWIIELIFSNE